ncbi:cohesin domain-containing protein [Lewinella sp. 4G2]|uniref:cohesin domain-containing protein n=1 Tax=Lewinella sp. 4G2 TaxID=1803372 RepID=UPI0007B4D2C9|nr:cohesin domain-containing protein [Lewinella sp. 4G2]OAV43904.1 hypothetical protein A3850_005085 [Lewinella sp. 4G2]
MKLFYTLLLSGLLAMLAPALQAQDLSVSLTDVEGQVGETVCMDFIGENFVAVKGMQFNLEYDPSVLMLSSYEASIADNAVSIIPSTSNPGLVRVTWLLFSVTGFTSDPGPFDFGDLCFTILSDEPTSVAITGNPIPIEFTNDQNMDIADFVVEAGEVNSGVGTSATCSDGIQNGSETGVDCGGPDCAPCGGTMTACGADTDDVQICLGSVCADAGTEACVPIFVGNFDGLGGFQFYLSVDDDNIAFNRFTAANSELETGVITGIPGDDLFSFTWNDLSGVGVSFPADQPAFELCFNVLNAAPTPLTFFDTDVRLRAFDELGNQLDVTSSPGAINVNCGDVTPTCDDGIQNGDETGIDCGGSCQPCTTGPNRDCGMDTDDLSICLGTACEIGVGEEICLDITVGNFTDVTGLNFDVIFPEANLTFTRITSNPSLSDDLIAIDQGMGVVRVQFFQFTQAGQDLSNGDNLGTICFTNNTAERTNLTLDELFASDNNNQSLAVIGNGGFINGCTVTMPTCDDGIQNGDETGIDCGGSCEPCAAVGDLGFRVGDAFGPIGSTVCVDVLATNFANVASFRLPLVHNADRLSFARINSTGPFANVTASNNAAGSVRITWPGNGSGVSVANGTALFEVCYEVLEQCNTSIVAVSRPAFPLDAVDANGNDINPIDFTPGTINGGLACDDTPPPGNAILQLSTEDGAVGETVCLDLTATDFDNLTDLNFTLTYDADVITFTEANNFGLAGLGATNIQNPSPGIITLQWASPTAGGETLADGATVASFCFTVDALSSTEIAFGNSPIITSATNADGADVQIVPVSGRINPNAPATDGLTVIIGSGTASAGESICLPVTGYDVDSLKSFQMTIAYDPALVTFTGRDNDVTFPLPGGLLLNANNPGVIRIIWSDPTGAGENPLADGTVLFGLCFEVITEDVAVISFEDEPIPTEFEKIDGIVTGTFVNGEINGSDAPVIVDADENNPTCSDLENGSIVLSVSGAGDLTYAWTGTDATGPIANNLSAGTYSVTITNAAGDSDTRTFTLTSPPPFNIGIDAIDPVVCNGENNGRIELSTIGGSAPFLIDWSDALNDGVLEQTNLAAGFYAVTISDGNGCRRQRRQIQIEEPDAIEIAGTIEGSGDDPRSINVVVEGGRGDYQFAWVGPNGFTANTEDIEMLSEFGEYCLTVTDESNCTERTCFNVEMDNVDLVATSTVAAQPACNDSQDGVVTLSFTGGRAPFTIVINPGGETVTATERSINLPLAGGDYTFNITGAGGRTTTATATVTAPDAITSNTVAVSDTEDTGCSGSITLNLTGGTGDYTIVWSNGASTSTITELCADTYSATVTDVNGCTFSTGDIVIGELQEDLVASNNASCPDANDGSIDVTISGGASPYTFSWTASGSTDEIANTEDLTDVMPGNYQLIATDATGASVTRLYSVAANAAFTVSTEVTSDYNGFGVSCVDGADGIITATVTGEGTFTYEYLLGDMIVGADPVLTGAGPGVYTVRITGDGGCESTSTITLTAPTAVTSAATINDVSCDDVNDGSIVAAPSGGVSPYTLAWSTGDSGTRISGLDAGTYSLTVTDANQCTSVESFTLETPEDLAFTVNATDATEECNGTIEVLTLGGSGSFVYTWPELPNQGNDPIARGLCPGDYTVIVSDANGCQSVTMIATVRDRRFPCLTARTVLTPNGDDQNETLVIFCSGDDAAANNSIQIFNRWGQLVYEVDDYDCSDNGGINCFDGRTNDGTPLSEGAYFYVFDYTNPTGEREQQRGSFTIIRD